MFHCHGNTGSLGGFLMSMNLLSNYFRVKKLHLLVNSFAPVRIVAKANDIAEMTFFCDICCFSTH